MFKSILYSSVTVLFLTGTACASPHILRVDSNQDGQISKSEFMAEARARFDVADKNKDNALSKEERKAGKEAHRLEMKAQYFKHLDVNDDGYISKAEHEAAQIEREAKRQEYKKKREQKYENEEKEMTSSREFDQADRRDRRKKDKMNYIEHDINQDGLITRAEHEAASEVLFAYLDANGDGVLTKGEGRKRKRRRFRN